MGRLFWKIFLWFWLTLILVLVVSNWVTAKYLQISSDEQSSSFVERIGQSRISAITEIIRFSGADAARRYLNNQPRDRRFRGRILVYDPQGREILGRRSEQQGDQANRIELEQSVSDPTGQQYRIVGTFRKWQRKRPVFPLFDRTFKRSPWLIAVWIGVALLLSSAICFWLAWYLTRPIRYLQQASRQLASGNLDVRVAAHMGKRRDEIADLGRDFDHMAERLQNLLLSQKQLLSDISHELRSPLARLQIALELTRKKTAAESIENAQRELDRIEREANRLEELIAQVLTLSRLETVHRQDQSKNDYVDLALFLEQIVEDAQFEARSQNRQVLLNCSDNGTVEANTELLHRAFENVIRNAIFYTRKNSAVGVHLQRADQHGFLQISICDQGPGVAEQKLETLFEPFVRLSGSRSRDSGGYGLGLAIAERAILLHDGEIRAQNRAAKDGGGLCIVIQLPYLEA